MTILALSVLAFAFFGILTIILLPKRIIPSSRSAAYDEILRVASARNSIRSTLAQIVAGLAFVATFIQSAANYSSDFKQKTDLATADQFAKAFSQLKDPAENVWVTIGSFYVLGNIAENDLRYREPVYGAMIQYIASRSGAMCNGDARRAEGNWLPYQQADYAMEKTIATSVRLFLDRSQSIRPQRMYDLRGACLVGGDLWGTKGLNWVYMPGVNLLRVAAGDAVISDSDLRGVKAGVIHNADWHLYEVLGAWSLHNTLSPEKTALLRANFENTTFTNVALDGAGLQGANLKNVVFSNTSLQGTNLSLADLTDANFKESDVNGTTFSGANIAHANLSNVKNLQLDQVLSACVREKGDGPDRSKANPSLPSGMATRLAKAGGMRVCG